MAVRLPRPAPHRLAAWGRVVVLLMAAWWAPLRAAEGPAAGPVQDPHYGDTLFHFYQGRYFGAITGLMVSQAFQRVPRHADEAELLRGGMLLSYGVHHEAGAIFTRLIEQGAAPAVRDRAWYFLAKIRYQRGHLADAAQALEQIGGALPAELEDDRVLLQSNVLLAQGRAPEAVRRLGEALGPAALGPAALGSPALGSPARGADVGALREGGLSPRAYANYNLGVAWVRSGDGPRGQALLAQLGDAPTPPGADEEFFSLRDRANVALGFAALQSGDADTAARHLERVRLQGPLSNKALLGFGWASAARKNPRDALVPWLALRERDPSDAAVLEAALAVPYAYGQLGAHGQALQGYQSALDLFDRESAALDASIAAVRSGTWVNTLLQRNPGDDMGWAGAIESWPALPHAAQLAPVLAQHEFQEAFKNWRDLHFLARNLQQWRQSLASFDDMLAHRRIAYARRLPAVLAQQRDGGEAALAARVAALRDEVARADGAADGAAYADAREWALQLTLDAVLATLQRAGPGAEADALRERHRLAQGALRWQQAQSFPARSHEAHKVLRRLDEGLADARQRRASLEQAQRDEPARFEAFAQRLHTLGQRLTTLAPQVAALQAEQQQALQEIAVVALGQQKERLAAYRVQARFAVAELYDRASQQKEGAR